MYNVRFIEYPTGYQFRVYSESISKREYKNKYDFDISEQFKAEVEYNGSLINQYTGEILASDFLYFREDFDNEWCSLPEDFDFEDLESYMLEQQEQEKQEQDFKRAECFRISFNRTRNNLFYLARSNVWEYFITLTVNPAKMDRSNLVVCSKKVRKWFDNLKQRKAPDLYYLLVPELHEDGVNWHFHGLIGGCKGLNFVDSGLKTRKGQVIYNWEDYKYGWTTAIEVYDTAGASSYICKYITKDLCKIVSGRQRYWVSNNVNRAQVYEMHLDVAQLMELRMNLEELSTWKKKVQSVVYALEYYECPLDDRLFNRRPELYDDEGYYKGLEDKDYERYLKKI